MVLHSFAAYTMHKYRRQNNVPFYRPTIWDIMGVIDYLEHGNAERLREYWGLPEPLRSHPWRNIRYCGRIF